MENIEWVHQRKSEKYEDLHGQNGWITNNTFFVENRCRVFFNANSTSACQIEFGLSPAEKKKEEIYQEIPRSAETASLWNLLSQSIIIRADHHFLIIQVSDNDEMYIYIMIKIQLKSVFNT